MQVLLDYNGHRLVAMPWLPLKGAELVYGSSDGGVTVHDSSPGVTAVMRLAAHELHLAGHTVKDQFLYTGGDVEVHATTGGRWFLVDMARALPPEHPGACEHMEKVDPCPPLPTPFAYHASGNPPPGCAMKTPTHLCTPAVHTYPPHKRDHTNRIARAAGGVERVLPQCAARVHEAPPGA